jgi:hypothetical protein
LIVENQSFAYDIRNAMYDIVSGYDYFAGWTCRKTRMLPVQTQLIPYLGVYIVDELMIPDGDPNAGCVRFIHTARIGFSAIQAAIDQDDLEGLMDESYQKIMIALWTNPDLMNVLKQANPEGVGIESAARGSRRHVFGATGTNNEFPFGELQYEISCLSRSEWYPDITDDFNEMDVTVAVNNKDINAVTPIHVKYMLQSLRNEMRRQNNG